MFKHKAFAFSALLLIVLGLKVLPDPRIGILLASIGAIGVLIIAHDADEHGGGDSV